MKHTDILAIVVSFNGLGTTLQTVDVLRNKVGHVYVVDNASDAESLDAIKRLSDEENVTVFRLDENMGVGYALNVGVAKAKEFGYSWLLTMDQDSIVDEFMIDSYCRTINRSQGLVCLTPNIIVNGRAEFVGGGSVGYAITSGNLVKASLYDEIGLYDEGMFIDCIDFDFSLRVRQAGYQIYQVADAKMYHELGDVDNVPRYFSKYYVSHSPVRRYYMFRNHMYLAGKYIYEFPVFIIKSTIANLLLLVFIPFLDKDPVASLVCVFRGVVDYFKRKTGMLKEVV